MSVLVHAIPSSDAAFLQLVLAGSEVPLYAFQLQSVALSRVLYYVSRVSFHGFPSMDEQYII